MGGLARPPRPPCNLPVWGGWAAVWAGWKVLWGDFPILESHNLHVAWPSIKLNAGLGGGGLWFEWGRLTHPPRLSWKMVVWGGRLQSEARIIRNINGLGGWAAVWVWFILYPTVFLNPVTIRTILARHHQNQQCSECIWMQCWNMNWGLRNTAGVQKHISNALSLSVFLNPQPILQHCIQMHSKH